MKKKVKKAKKKTKNKKNKRVKKYNYTKYTGIIDDVFVLLINLNNSFRLIINCMQKNHLTVDNLHPSTVINYQNNLKIKPFWNSKIQKLSDKLFLPSTENLVHIDNDNINTFDANSWFSVKHYTGLDKKFYKLKTKDHEQSIKKITKCKQVKIYFNKNQKKYMKQIIGIYRYFYNRCVAYLNNYDKIINTSRLFR